MYKKSHKLILSFQKISKKIFIRLSHLLPHELVHGLVDAERPCNGHATLEGDNVGDINV